MKMDDPVAYTPEVIQRVGETGIRIQWSDGVQTEWTAQQLRDACPCATCREKHGKRPADEAAGETPQAAPKMTGLPVLSAAEARPTRIDSMQPIGTYAYNIAFSDGHHSGLYTFARLRGETS